MEKIQMAKSDMGKEIAGMLEELSYRDANLIYLLTKKLVAKRKEKRKIAKVQEEQCV